MFWGKKKSNAISRAEFMEAMAQGHKAAFNSEAIKFGDGDTKPSDPRLSGADPKIALAGGNANERSAFRGNPDHLAKLKEGVAAWNAWREENPDIQPDLRSLDLTDPAFHETALWDEELEKISCARANFTGANCRDANFTKANCPHANFTGAFCLYADFENADCLCANFTDANCWEINFHKTQLSLANFKDTNVSGVIYDKRELIGRCHGIRATECYGDAKFRRLVMDQDYIDQLAREHLPPKKMTLMIRLRRLFGGFAKPAAWIGGLVLGLGLMFWDGFPDTGGIAQLANAQTYTQPGLAIFGFALAIVGFFLGKAGQLVLFRLWGLFDYGRDWDRVVIFAALMIMLFGGFYANLGAEHLYFHRDASEIFADRQIWFYPWFVAMMGFATLGVTDLVEPVTSLGALVMMGNVLSGFATLGLLLSVLGEKFARRG